MPIGGFGGGGAGGLLGGGGAGLGGAVFSMYGSVTVVNSTFTGNNADGGAGGSGAGSGYGGAIFNLDGSVSLTSATLAGDHVTTDGGELYNLAYGKTPAGGVVNATAAIVNSILADSTGGASDLVNDTDAMHASGTATVTADFSLIRSGGTANVASGGNNVYNQDPMLAQLASNGGPTETLALAAGSPAAGVGDTFAPGATDQRGFERPFGTPSDIGAFQTQGASDEGGYDLTLQLKQGDANTLQLFRDGALIDQRALGGLNSYTITDTGTNAIPSDFLTVDYTNGFFSLPGGVTFSGDGTSRLFVVDPTAGQTYSVSAAAAGRVAAPVAYSGLYLLTLDAGGGDTVEVHGTAVATSVATGPGANTVLVAPDAGLLGNALHGQLVVNAGSGGNTLAVSEANNSTGDAVAVTADSIVGQGPSSEAPGAVAFQIAYGGNFGVVGLTTGSGDDLVTVLGTDDPTNINTGAGNDRISVVAQTGLLGGVLAGPLNIDAGSGNNTLSVSEAAATIGDTLTLTGNAIVGQGSSPFAIGYTATGGTFGSVALATGTGPDSITVAGKRADGGQLDVNAGGGGDTVKVEVTNTSLYGNFYVDGGAANASGDELFFLDESGGAAFQTLPLSVSQRIEQASYEGTDVSDVVFSDFGSLQTS